ncbi:MAG: sulfatase-like hydrolase/transferase, partial [Legionellales bacterium]|nr:sulfatase-like hydrolase/transferase [Legionellales bacterium]
MTSRLIFCRARRITGTLRFLSWLTLFFIGVQIAFAITNNFDYLKAAEILHQHIAFPHIILPGLLQCIVAFLGLHLLLVLGLWVILRLNFSFWEMDQTQANTLSLWTWVLAIVCIMLANEYYYPLSQFSKLLAEIIPHTLSIYLLILLLIPLAIMVVIAVLQWITHAFQQGKSYGICSILIIVSLISAIFYTLYSKPTINHYIAPASSPNVIIIGIDSLRPDHTGVYNSSVKLTPHLDTFLHSATNFNQALTPLARTFPAWMSILTGNYPLKHGARYDLIDPQFLHLDNNLAAVLQQHHYHTIYATDDKRFSNIDKRYNFDEILGPKIGLLDFILGNLNDFPLSNLVINTSIGHWLFPYNTGNRQTLATYDPQRFNHMVEQGLRQNFHQPIFLCVHFCLPHYPYGWSKKLKYIPPPLNSSQAHYLYDQAVQTADQQFAELINFLQQDNLLQHAIVVVISDHGEALGVPDRLTHPNMYQGDINHSALKKLFASYDPPIALDFSTGHGTDILSMDQYHIVFSWRLLNTPAKNLNKKIDEQVSLIDIKPTILDLLHLPVGQQEGISLAKIILGKSTPPNSPRYFYLSSGFTPQAVMSTHPNEKLLATQSANYFSVDPKTGYVIVKHDMGKLIIGSKELGIIHQNWLLALYPKLNHQIPVLVNLASGKWSDDMDSAFVKKSPFTTLLQQLKLYYG